jgi:hypothetical protein
VSVVVEGVTSRCSGLALGLSDEGTDTLDVVVIVGFVAGVVIVEVEVDVVEEEVEVGVCVQFV